MPWWVLPGSILQIYANLFLQSYKHFSWHMVCNGKKWPATLPNTVIVNVEEGKVWVVSFSVCVCVQRVCCDCSLPGCAQYRHFSESAEHNNLREKKEMGKRVLAAGPRKADTGIQAGMSSMRVVNRAICVCLLKNQRKRERKERRMITLKALDSSVQKVSF